YLTRRYRVVSLGELCGELRRGVVTPHTVAITIDDGYHEVASLVAPLLRRYDAPATFFVVSDLVDGRLWLWTDKFRFVFDHAPAGLIHVKTGAGVQRIEIRETDDRAWHADRWREHAKRLPLDERDELLTTLSRTWGLEIPTEPPAEYRAMTWAEL